MNTFSICTSLKLVFQNQLVLCIIFTQQEYFFKYIFLLQRKFLTSHFLTYGNLLPTVYSLLVVFFFFLTLLIPIQEFTSCVLIRILKKSKLNLQQFKNTPKRYLIVVILDIIRYILGCYILRQIFSLLCFYVQISNVNRVCDRKYESGEVCIEFDLECSTILFKGGIWVGIGFPFFCFYRQRNVYRDYWLTFKSVMIIG
eukprot:TRINITY_DN4936_c0_g1_i2.p4 TRINITY_DN4936_c0_g1~~TRINITY_DN4936_c0_g1_i2.p4  ORF type:complete len:199 (-),score=-8.65 TRINITY_DN4936_c0_g1_i2:199-795(-)